MIGGNIVIHITKLKMNVVDLVIDAPEDISIVRTEVMLKDAYNAKNGNTVDTVGDREGLPRDTGVSQAES